MIPKLYHPPLKLLFHAVRGQQLVQCRASTDCTSGAGDDLGRAVDGRSCCVDNPRALAYIPSDGICTPCVGESALYYLAIGPDN